MIPIFLETISDCTALIGKTEQVVKGSAALLPRMEKFCRAGNIIQPTHNPVAGNKHRVHPLHNTNRICLNLIHHKEIHRFIEELHTHIHIKNGYTGFVIKVAEHRADRHMRRTMEANINLPLKALPQ